MGREEDVMVSGSFLNLSAFIALYIPSLSLSLRCSERLAVVIVGFYIECRIQYFVH